MLIAIDPGTTESAFVIMDGDRVKDKGIVRNPAMLDVLQAWSGIAEHAAIEMIASYGMPVGREVFETCVWIGRFIERFDGPHTLVYRKDVKMNLCGTPRAKDGNIRQVLLDRYGPGKEAAIGRKAAPGPLYGFKSHLWAALAVGCTWYDQQNKEQ